MVAPGSASFGAAVSEHPDPAHAVGEAAGAVLERVGPGADMALVFVSPPHAEEIGEIAAATQAILDAGAVLATTTESVIGGATEVEEGVAVSVWAAKTGPVEAVRLEVARSSEGAAVIGMPDTAAIGRRCLIVLADPYSFPAEAFVDAANTQYPLLTIVGGVASSAGRGQSRLAIGASVHLDGAVGILLPEGLDAEAVVSQGCRPVGEPFTITDAEGSTVRELASRPALERLSELVDQSSVGDRELLARGLHVGLVVNETTDAFGSGDFLIRAVLGVEPSEGALRIGDRAPIGSILQFHVRDAASASADLAATLAGIDADAALLFTCNGRGNSLFGEPDHDATSVVAAVHGGAVGGMSCAGEIGPVHGVNHVHGFTASTLFFYG